MLGRVVLDGENANGVVASCISSGKHTGRVMMGREVVRMLVEQLRLFKGKVDYVQLERTKTIEYRVARLRIVIWIHPDQSMEGCGR